MLDRIGDMLDEAGIIYARLDGTMMRDERAKAVERLQKHAKTEVLLVSTRAGGVGLNLTAASRCFLVDPYWYAVRSLDLIQTADEYQESFS